MFIVWTHSLVHAVAIPWVQPGSIHYSPCNWHELQIAPSQQQLLPRMTLVKTTPLFNKESLTLIFSIWLFLTSPKTPSVPNIESCLFSLTWLFTFFKRSWKAISNDFYYQGQFWPSGIVATCVYLSVRLCIRPSVHHLFACPAITCVPFKLGSPNFDQRLNTPLVKICIVLGGDWPWLSGPNVI